ncbi:MAG TPA: hypothetical protein VFP84_36245 [Kofleriaceae bacterium]|nr:hypothetical protein [Kofleriaceae bacterium]
MGSSRRVAMTVASITLIAFLSGCFGYNKSAKRWAYVGDAILLVGGGTAIAIDVTQKETPCKPDEMGNGCTFQPSVHGALIAGVVLAAAGLFGILFNATRDDVKTSR